MPHINCIITADGDGQHSLEDIVFLKKEFFKNNPDLVIGIRTFDKNIPKRSKIGNLLTAGFFKILFGKKIFDTQTGLRAFNKEFAKSLLKIPYNGYEFEMDMLVSSLQKDIEILQIPINTIYINNNASSHFNPLRDSISIYFVLFRHIINSLLTAMIDYLVFVILFTLGYSLLFCMIGGRFIAGSFNFIVGKTMVFKSKNSIFMELGGYVFLTIVLMLLSMQGIKILVSYTGLSEIIIKPICELMIFAISFLIQRLIIFTPSAKITNLSSLDSNGGGGEEKTKN